MRRLTTGILAGVIVLTLIGGGLVYAATSCATTMSWDLEVGVDETTVTENGSVAFRGEAGITGSTGQPRVQGVEVVFIGENGTELTAIPLGDFGVNAQKTRNITVTLPERPVRVELRAEQIDADPDSEWSLLGLEWTGEMYRSITVRSSPEPWYC
ncbi:hypothetical protein [Salinirubrum litoreum]|uniref:Uncharacterized protein n=1 Tax=Salinirubrum litoreum TaxID=1126234 RepID=A0ABD5RF41_9EURY|nr:hypothetical protein [Salinirubrum litoreum]